MRGAWTHRTHSSSAALSTSWPEQWSLSSGYPMWCVGLTQHWSWCYRKCLWWAGLSSKLVCINVNYNSYNIIIFSEILSSSTQQKQVCDCDLLVQIMIVCSHYCSDNGQWAVCDKIRGRLYKTRQNSFAIQNSFLRILSICILYP